jgi:3-phenylpropionate/cinnamic acid dioxygenase small subunit
MDGAVFSTDQKARVDDLYARYAETICDGDLEAWPDFFIDDCRYHVRPRTNHERGQLLGPIYSESKGALVDRVLAIRNSMVFMPRAVCYVVGSIRIVEAGTDNLTTRSMFSAYHTLETGDSEVLMVGRTFDELVLDGDDLKFRERIVVFDTERVPGALVYPV